MPTDMKRLIAEATQTLLLERHVKKLTVKDIVEECHITRQAFYYHFAGIPELLRWMIEGYFEQVMGTALAAERTHRYARCTHTQLKALQRYHCHGILGLLEAWTEADTEQLDQIVHTLYHIMTAEVPPWTGGS